MSEYNSFLHFPKCGLHLSSLSFSNIRFVLSKFFPSYSLRQKLYFILLLLLRFRHFSFSSKHSHLTLSSNSTHHFFVLSAGISFKVTRLSGAKFLRSAALYLPRIPEVQIVYAQDSLLITSTPIYKGQSLSWHHPSISAAFSHALLEIKLRAGTSSSFHLDSYISSLLDSSAAHNRFHLSCLLHRLSLLLDSTAQFSLSHGDLKPQNIVKTFDPHRPFKLLDWELVDVRSSTHDAFNILIHFIVEYSSPPPRVVAVSFSDFCLKYLPQIEPTNCLQLLKLSLFEKLYLYLESGKWPSLEQCLISRINYCCSFIDSHEFFSSRA